MNKKLLYKTQRIYLTYFVVVFIITAPLFYLIIHQMYIANADESLRLRAYQFRKDNVFSLQEADIPIWNKYNRDVKILQNKELKTDRIFYAYYYEDQEEETELYRELNAPISIDNKRYTLSARTNLLESEDLIIGIVILFIVILILLLIGLFVINRSLSNRLWKPFYQTLQKIEDFEIDKSRKPIFPDSNIEEFNRLSSSVENLIIRNISIYDDQLEFVENAAHELQTPIAIFKAQIGRESG
ncbi:MAG TPA: sensor histidine kinase, partial [Saprospiraceae bacterium]|nr:sensor histidine kinase [Saprospiraceae bacterium]